MSRIDHCDRLVSSIEKWYRSYIYILNLYADLFYDLLKLTLIHIDSQRTRLLGGQNQNQQLFGCKTKENDNLNGDNLTYSRIHSNGYPISNLISSVGFSKNPWKSCTNAIDKTSRASLQKQWLRRRVVLPNHQETVQILNECWHPKTRQDKTRQELFYGTTTKFVSGKKKETSLKMKWQKGTQACKGLWLVALEIHSEIGHS